VSDELNHASIVDGCRLSRSRVVVTPHLDVAAVDRAVSRAPGRAVVVTESVFSMDGDVAPLDDLAEVCRRAGALLVVDEAHAVLGPPVASSADVLRVGTLSKALGALGGFVAGPAALCDLLVNRARTFVFTTASTPADTAAALAAVEVVRSPEGDALRARLRTNVDRLRPGHPSPIVPVLVGGEEAALAASASLLDGGLLVPAIRPPTVPPGTSRLRVSLSAAHTAGQVDRLAAALAALGASPSGPAPSPMRPRRLVVVLGTGTGVGKTWVAAALARVLREGGGTVAARKPVQSFEAGDGPTDADVLACATGVAPSEVCARHRWYETAMAPPMAAAALGRPPFRLADLMGELVWPDTEWGLVEGVGGPRSPLAVDADNVALARALRPDAVVLVAPAGLGTINAVLLAIDALPLPPVVLLNRYDGGDRLHAGNRRWLESRGVEVVTTVGDLAGALG
jgi:dethiobiotin synthetase